MTSRFVLYVKSRLSMNKRQLETVFLTITLICIILVMSYIHCNKKTRIKRNVLDDDRRTRDIVQLDTGFLIGKLKEITNEKFRIKHIKEIITPINDRQHIGRVKKLNTTAMLKALERFKFINNQKLDAVLVIQVHGNYRYVEVLLESLKRVLGIHESLLIFVHDYYDAKVYNILNGVHFTRVMQIFYPYSVQLHPYRFPGGDQKFCPQLNKCTNSNERDPLASQKKLFWWWTVNEIFDHVDILKKYHGFVYFLEVEQYLTTDFLILAKVLEKRLTFYCAECKIISLADRPPKPHFYRRENTSLVISIWGWSKIKYISSGFGFNRTTWNEIKDLKEEFCYFDDYTWENSLKHLASKSRQKAFYVLSVKGPRIFPTNNCKALGVDGSCDIGSTYLDVAKFIRTTASGMFPYKYDLEVDTMDGLNSTDVVEDCGGWDDARDRELCIFIASHGRRVYY